MFGANMAHRDHTKHFRELRNNCKKNDSQSSGADSVVDYTTMPLVSAKSSINHNNNNNLNHDILLELQISPVWNETLQNMDNEVVNIEQLIKSLKDYHSLRSRILFESEKSAELDANIQETTMAITSMFRRCKNDLKRIAKSGSDVDELPYEERVIRLNIMKSRALRMQGLTKEFRRTQREYLQNIKAKEDRSSVHFENNNVLDVIKLDRVQQGMTASQLQELEEIERDADQRTKGIILIAKSVHELAQLFDELSVLICEQGSLLDRIDYNVEQVVEHLGSAKVHIDKAVVYQKRSRTAMCILVLIIIVILAGVILILKNINY